MTLSQQSFDAVTDLFHRVSGIRLTEAKRSLVVGRLQKLAQASGARDLEQYVRELVRSDNPAELVRVVDKLTTNETYFFREPQHYNFLADLLGRLPPGNEPLRAWSAASSSGEEAYTMAMVMADRLGRRPWEIVGTDLSTAMVDTARRGLYPMERAQHVPQHLLKRWCLKGQDEMAGQLLVAGELRRHVRFECANLTQTLPQIGTFEVIFLRNVLIYFDAPGKADIVRRVLTRLKPGGHLFTGHAESLSNLDLAVRSIAPAVYVHA
jgi:chemotaxis protein methyltransferase CheR